jgi:hypothetical protein
MKRTILLLVSLVLSACAAITGYPRQPKSLPTTMTSLDQSTISDLITEYNASGTSTDQKKVIRDRIIYSDISQIDQNFNDFKVGLNSQENILSVGTTFTSLALAGLGATIGGAATKAALAAASAGVIGAKAGIDKDLLYQKTITALTTEMEAQRSLVFARIITNMHLNVVNYPLEGASKDLEDYYQAGTLVNALEGVAQSAGEKAQAADIKVAAALRSLPMSNSSSTQRIRSWLYSGPNDAQGKPTLDKAKFASVQTWMNNDTTDPNLQSIPPEQFIDGNDPGLEADRQRLLADPTLKIP